MEYSLTEVLRTVAGTVPEREAIVHGSHRATYAEFLDEVERLGRVLAARGLGAHTERDALEGWQAGQDRLALYLHNCPEYLVGMYGAYAARVAPFNVNYRYVADELRYLLDDSGARAVLFHSTFAPTLAEVLDDLAVDDLVLLQVPDESGNPLLPGAEWYRDALDAAPAVDLPTPSVDDLYILYTGGTTGMPKGVLWRQADIYPAALGGRKISTGAEYDSLDEIRENALANGMRVLPSAPFMHGAAHWMAMNAFHNGNTVIIQDRASTFDPTDVVAVIEREKVNILLLVGDAFGRPLLDELERAPHDTSSMMLLISGGAALSAPVKAALLEQIPTTAIMDGLGSSEAGTQASQVVGAGQEVSTGTFKAGTGSCIVDEELTHLLEPGHDGIGWLAQHGHIPLGYLGDADKTARTFPVIDGQRVSIPGDRARLLVDGTIELHGRDSVTINSGGEKIFAEEVEAALMHHPAVYDAVVAGRPSERWGSEVVAVVQLREGHDAGVDDLRESCAAHIARYKLPKDIVFVDRIVRSPAGKADYRWARSVITATEDR